MQFELLGPVAVLGAYLLFVWWIWRERGWMSSVRKDRESKRRSHDVQEWVLFVCTHNSARSQMAEALLRRAAGSRFIVASAGTDPTRLHPTAEQVMAERGIALDSHRAKSLAEVGTDWSYAITVCDAAFERCPDFSLKTSRLHWSIEDPAAASGTPHELDAFRRVRDELAFRIDRWLAER